LWNLICSKNPLLCQYFCRNDALKIFVILKNNIKGDPERSFIFRTDQLDQNDVDRALNSGRSELHESPELPKGIDGLTLEKVQHIFSVRQDSSLTSEEVSSLIGASRTTVRRYLEYLVSQTILDVDVNYGGVGRPERRYFLRRHL
jgi:response regulator of citrate/malate metabolism